MSIEKFKSSESEHQYLSALWQVSPNIDDGEIELHEQERRLLLQPTVLELATITLFNNLQLTNTKMTHFHTAHLSQGFYYPPS